MRASTYPGTAEHQSLLRAIAEQYAADDRMLAFSVFGSLGRGTWDQYSDLDLDVVIADGVTIDAPAEARRLCARIGQEPVVVVPDRDDAADIVLASLMELSIRYHPLHNTSPNIVDSLVVLAGRLDHATIAAAGLANRRARRPDLADLVGACVRQAVNVDASLHRRTYWRGFLVLQQAREELLRLFVATHGAQRPYHGFEVAADRALQARLGRTLPEYDLRSLQRAFIALLDVLEHDLDAIGAGQAHLTEDQRGVLAQLRARQAALDLTKTA
jgi:predicted nucleotidyltransferase